MTESESVALPFGDSPSFLIDIERRDSQHDELYNTPLKNASTFFKFFKVFLTRNFCEGWFDDWQHSIDRMPVLSYTYICDLELLVPTNCSVAMQLSQF